MTEHVTIKSFREGNPWSSPDGKISLTFYETTFERNGSDFVANWGRKGAEPTVGETVEGEFFMKGDQQRFKLASGDGPQNNSTNWQGAAGSPQTIDYSERSNRIERQHSQSAAVAYFAIAGKQPGLDDLEKAIDWFQRDVGKIAVAPDAPPGQTAGPPPPLAQPETDLPPVEAPSSNGGPAPDDDIPF